MKLYLKAAVSMIIFMFISAASVYAYEIGDVIGTVRYSGINTYINNYPIQSYHLDGRQLICAEDLRGYGFSVQWSQESRSLSIERDISAAGIIRNNDIKRKVYMANKRAYDIIYTDIAVYISGKQVESYSIDGRMMIKLRDLEVFGEVSYSAEENYSKLTIDGMPEAEYKPPEEDYESKITVVLDPGHGKDSGNMNDEEKYDSGYDYYNGSWGEWRNWKNGSSSEDCRGDGCNYYGNCWYSITNGDRDTEPEINLRNALAAKSKLEEMGYNVRMTRYSNDENPSFKNRIACCYPQNDLNAAPDAACYVCIHSNAGGGRGSAYIEADGDYTQKWINSAYAENSNLLGMYINERITEQTSLTKYSGGKINGLGYMILFNKCPVPTGYIEIGFYDSYDLDILNNEYEKIGTSIAEGINDYMWN
ncbi:MAG: N-acetylmuramoyl-L-alanine amidase [bacterium]|nr:N-acetylmuramoyl-L-alanine amidase [bacterium]